MNTSTKKYVVLEHLTLPDRGFRFWTSNTANNTHSETGELWYKEIVSTDSADEAVIECAKTNHQAVAKFHELVEYYRQLKHEE